MSGFCVPKTGKSDAYGHQLCKKWNDGRGCVADSHCKKSHVCDVLINPQAICGASNHTRYDHDGPVFGWLQAQRPEDEGSWKARSFWQWYGSPAKSPQTRRDPVPAVQAKKEQAKQEQAKKEQDDPKQGPPWKKSWADDLYYWDRNWKAILYDAARAAHEDEVLRCPAAGCNWNVKVGSKSHMDPDFMFSQHLGAEDIQADDNHPDEDQWNRIWAHITVESEAGGSGDEDDADEEPSGPAAGSTKRPRTR